MKNILERESVDRFSDEELGGFLYSMNGDMRRAITEIQAAKSSNSTLKKQVEVTLSEYTDLINKSLTPKKHEILTDLHNMLYQGKSMKEICGGLHDAVVNSKGLDSALKYKLLRAIEKQNGVPIG